EIEKEKSRKVKELLQKEREDIGLDKLKELENDFKQSLANKSTTGTHRILTQFLEKINLTVDDLQDEIGKLLMDVASLNDLQLMDKAFETILVVKAMNNRRKRKDDNQEEMRPKKRSRQEE